MSTGFAEHASPIEARLAQACAGISAEDARADDRRRTVTLTQHRVTIERSYRGIAMRVSIPVGLYQGVCVALKSGSTGRGVYEIRLSHHDDELSVLLATASDDDEIWADWRSWAQFFRLPALIERNEGVAVWGRNPGLRAAAVRRAKRHRPAFLLRRFGTPGIAKAVHRDPEMIAPS